MSQNGTTAGPGLIETSLNLPLIHRGKVRDLFSLPPAPSGESNLLIVATDRISAFDVIMPTPIPGKGRLLTQLSSFWLKMVSESGIAKTHLVSTDIKSLPQSAFGPGTVTPAELEGRISIVRQAAVVPIECVVRGYLEGSGWREYQATGAVCGVPLPRGLKQCDRLPEPIFTPATKEQAGKHDENITFERACELTGAQTMTKLREMSLQIYSMAAAYAQKRGIIIADTKFEFGKVTDAQGQESLILVDEALTPDSSRFWPESDYAPGRAQRSFDKQHLREWLEELVRQGIWNKQAPGPSLPPSIVEATQQRYEEASKRLTA